MPKKIYRGWKNYTEPAGQLHTDEEYTVPRNTYIELQPYVCPKNKMMPWARIFPKSDELRDTFYKKTRDADPRSKAEDDYETFYWKDSSMETRSETKLREQTLQVLERKLI